MVLNWIVWVCAETQTKRFGQFGLVNLGGVEV